MLNIFRKTSEFPLNDGSIEQATIFVQKALEASGIDSKETMKGTLVAEEAIGSLISHAEKDGKVRIRVRKILGDIVIDMSAPGEEYSLSNTISAGSLLLDDEIGKEAQETIRSILLRSLTADLKYSHKDGCNHIRMTVVKSKRAFLYKTLVSLFAAVVVGLLLSAYAPEQFNAGLNQYILTPVKTMYLNALKMIVAPVVFFSIISCIAGFGNLADLGKIGGKTFALYMLTTVIAVATGIGVFYLFKPGQTSLAASIQTGNAASGSSSSSLSFTGILMDIVPSNFIEPFRTSNMPQLIFLAVLCGVATGLIGHFSAVLKSLFEACNELFLKIASMIIRLMPIAIFCSIASMILDLGIQTILSVVGMIGTFIFGLVCMMLIYCLLVLVIGRIDPRPLIRKYSPVMLQVFSMASSNAAIPLNIEACEKKLGIGSKVYSLSIPLGSTLNMDGTCIQLAVFALALAQVYGVTVSPGSLIVLAFTIIILSMGAPGIPGAGIICLSVLLEQLHVPTEAVGLVMGIGPILGMFLSMSNCLGDVVVTTIVAKKSNELNLEKYRS